MDAYFGIVLEVNGKEIALEPKTAINKIKELGIEAELPAGTEVHLGSIAGGLEKFAKTIDPSFALPAQADLPLQPLRDAYGALTTAELTINDLYLKIPPAGSQDSTAYRLGLYVGWSGDAKTLVGDLKLKGFSIKLDGTQKNGTDKAADKKPIAK
jgi:hypothetical protein